MTFAEFRQNLFTMRAEIASLSLFAEDVCKTQLKGFAVSRAIWEAVHPEAVDYVIMFNLPSLVIASRTIVIDNVQIFLVDEPDIFCPLVELPNLTQHNGPNKQREVV